jgi:hypothetical protein
MTSPLWACRARFGGAPRGVDAFPDGQAAPHRRDRLASKRCSEQTLLDVEVLNDQQMRGAINA